MRITAPYYKKRKVAYKATREAIKEGRLIRKPCQVFGNPKSDAHHEDYDKP